jgi:hypothetical protein
MDWEDWEGADEFLTRAFEEAEFYLSMVPPDDASGAE